MIFTKEELEIISGSLYFTLLHKHSEMTANARKKVQLMIENYCDHKGAIPSIKSYTSFHCTKCGKEPV